MVRLGDVCVEIRERIPSTGVSPENYVTTDNMIKACGGIRPADSVPAGTSLVRYATGDVLVSNIRPYLRKVWLADRDGGCSSDVIVFRRDRHDLAPEYLFRVLSQDGFSNYVMQNVSGTKMPRGKRDWIKGFRFPAPPLPVQHEIVTRLKKELAEVDRLAANYKRIAERAEDEFKAELEEIFRGVEGKKVRLGNLGRVAMCKRVLKEQTSETGAIPFFKIGTFGKRADAFISQELFDDFSRNYSYPNPGDVLISAAGTIGRTVVFDGIPSYFQDSNIVWLKHDGSRLLNTYLRYFYRLKPWEVSVGVTIPRIYNGDIERTEIPLPTLSTQRAVVAKLDATKARCEKLKAAAEKGLQAAEKLRAAILAEAFEP